MPATISTHTLRGERDDGINTVPKEKDISTHTLRGERDKRYSYIGIETINFNSHAPWGA